MFEEKRDKAQCTFFFELDGSKLPASIKNSRYMLAIYKISVSRTIFDRPIVTDSLYPILFDIDNAQIIENHELAEKFMGRAQVDGHYAPLEENMKLDSDMIDDLRYDLKECIESYIIAHKRELQTRIDNSKKMRYQQTLQYYEFRIKNLKSDIKDHEYNREVAIMTNNVDNLRAEDRILRLRRGQLKNMEERRESDLERINRDVQLKVTEEIKSLNLVQVV
jgi:hypothetical protein